jgi:hypothetical protein
MRSLAPIRDSISAHTQPSFPTRTSIERGQHGGNSPYGLYSLRTAATAFPDLSEKTEIALLAPTSPSMVRRCGHCDSYK